MSHTTNQSVLDWLYSINSANDPITPTRKKPTRSPLADRSANRNAMDYRTPSSSPKKRKTNQGFDVLEDEDVTDTPRPPTFSDNTSLQSGSASSVASVSSSRSRSPTKQIAAMRIATEPITFEQIGTEGPEDFSPELKGLVLQINRFSRGLGVISKNYGMDTILKEKINDLELALTQPENLPGPSPTPDKCLKAVWLAQRCEKIRQSEAAWNSSVHNFVLDLALHHSNYTNDVYFMNCTTARIEPASLIPRSQGLKLNSKMVDFVIHIELSQKVERLLFERAQQSIKPMSINQTYYEPLRWRPISVSIETKHTGEKWTEAMIQVGTWASAHFKKLEELMQQVKEDSTESEDQRATRDIPTSSLPFLPLIIVQGQDWNFLVAIRDPGRQTTLYQKIGFGSTSSVLGVYQVVVTIQLLANYTRDTFKVWFEEHCLGLSN